MSINKKVSILVFSLFVLITFLFVLTLENRKASTLDFENKLVRNKVHNLNNILKDRLNVLNRISYEYSSLKNINSKNLNNLTSKLNINYFIILDKNKKILYSQVYDLNSKEFLDISSDIEDTFEKINFEEVLLNKEKIKFITMDYEKVLFSIDTIEDIGYVFVAKTIDSNFLSNISSILDSYVFFIPSHKLHNVHFYKDLKYDILRDSEDYIYSDIQYKDILENEYFFISVKIARDYFKEISNSNYELIFLFVLVSIVLISIMYFFINKIFINRIDYISKTVKEISLNKDLNKSIIIEYDDEISYLSYKMNEMFKEINNSQNEKIKKERDFLQSVLDSQQHIIFITDGNTIQSANKKFLDIFESKNNFFNNLTFVDTNVKNHLLKVAKKHSSIDKPAKFKTNKNDFKYFVFDISRVEVQKYIVCMNDVSQVNEKINQLKFEASTDKLTSCLNKASLNRYFDYWLETKDFGLIILDIDKFKSINDTYGHLCGDTVLKQLALLLKTHLQKDDIIGRFGGEEFVLLVNESNIINLEKISNRLRILVQNHIFKHEDLELNVTVSIGCTICLKGEDLEQLFNTADEALYEAKNSGRNKVIYKQIAA